MTINTTLSHRGFELASLPSLRERFKTILGDPYDPDKNPNGFVNIGVAENFAVIDEVKDFVNKNLKLQSLDFSYGEGPWGTKRLRTAMAKHMQKHFKSVFTIDPEDIIVASGVTSLCEMLGFTIADHGDGILFSRPIYQAFQVDFGTKAKVKSVFTDFGDIDQFSTDCVAKYEAAFHRAESQGIKVRALMLCNPHNPLGQCYPKDTIIALMKFCEKYKLHLLCDEIYASSVYEVEDSHAVPFTSALSFDHTKYISADLLHVFYGMSKDFGAGGCRLGVMYIRNKELMRAMSAITQFHWSGGPNEEVATLLLENEEWLQDFFAMARARLAERNKLTRNLLDDVGIDYHKGANAGFFIWVDLRPYLPPAEGSKDEWDREVALVEKFMKNGVFVTNGQMLSAAEPGWFRVIFSQEERTIREGLRRVFETIGAKSNELSVRLKA